MLGSVKGAKMGNGVSYAYSSVVRYRRYVGVLSMGVSFGALSCARSASCCERRELHCCEVCWSTDVWLLLEVCSVRPAAVGGEADHLDYVHMRVFDV